MYTNINKALIFDNLSNLSFMFQSFIFPGLEEAPGDDKAPGSGYF